MNYSELDHVVRHLNFLLDHAVVDQISDNHCRLQFGLRRYVHAEENRRTFVIIDFKASHLDIYTTRYPKKAPAVPQAFTMLMRKYLIGMNLINIRLAADDRIVFFDFGHDQDIQFTLIAELTGCSPKIFLIDAENQQILGLVGDEEERCIHTEYIRPEANLVKIGTDRFSELTGQDYEKALDDWCTARDDEEEYQTEYRNLQKLLKRSVTINAKKIASLQADLDKVELAKVEKQEADLLNAYAWKIGKGESSVDLPDFETGSPVHILLDPTLSVRGNIDKKYHHSKRLLKAQPQIENRLLQAMERRDRLNTVASKFQSIQDLASLNELKPEIEDLCRVDDKRSSYGNERRQTQTKPAVHQPYKIFTASDGTKIYVGKSASDNDELTFHKSRGNDYWLHVCQVPGSHVVVKNSSPSQETLLDAALLALHYSKIAQSQTAEIHVTQVKYVRKPKGAPPGKVEIRGEKSIHIRKDEKRLARLLATEV